MDKIINTNKKTLNKTVIKGTLDIPDIDTINYKTPIKQGIELFSPLDINRLRQSVYNNIYKSVQSLFPIRNQKYELGIERLDYYGPESITLNQQKHFILSKQTPARKLLATIYLKDLKTGQIIDRKRTTLVKVPILTDRNTFIMNGSEYAIANQQRLLPGVYHKRSSATEVFAHINPPIGGGKSHKIILDQLRGVFLVELGQARIPLISLLKILGVSDSEIKQLWGPEIYAKNMQIIRADDLKRFYKKFIPFGTATSPEKMQKELINELSKYTFDPKVNEITLGVPYANYNPELLLRSSEKLLKIARGEEEPDNRDAMTFQIVMQPSHLLAERLQLGKKHLNSQLWKSTYKGNLKQSNFDLTPYIYDVFYKSGLGQCYVGTTYVYTYNGFKKIRDITDNDYIYTYDIERNLKGFFKPRKIYHYKYNDLIYHFISQNKPGVQYHVTSDHRMLCRFPDEETYSFKLAKDVHCKAFYVKDNNGNEILISPDTGFFFVSQAVNEDVYCLSVEYTTMLVCGVETDRDLTEEDIPFWCGNSMEEINPMEILDYTVRISRMGYGGISKEAIPEESRNVQLTNIGFIDLIHTPEKLTVGLDNRLAIAAKIGPDQRLYTPVYDIKNKNWIYLNAMQMFNYKIGFPDTWSSNEPLYQHSQPVLHMGKLIMVPRSEVDFIFPRFESTFTALTGLVPLKSTSYPQRLAMGARYISQAVPLYEDSNTTSNIKGAAPLLEREAPLVSTKVPGSEKSFEELFSEWSGAKFSPVDGVIEEVTEQYITIRDKSNRKHIIELYYNFPFNRKTYIHNKPKVKVGDQVEKGQLLATSNYTDDDGVLALGLNAKVAYIPTGKNYQDAFVVSESFAKRATSTHMHQAELELLEGQVLGKQAFASIFPGRFNTEQLRKLDNNGVIKVGETVQPGDPLIVVAEKYLPSYKNIAGRKKYSFQDKSIVWEHDLPGEVVDVYKSDKLITVTVKYNSPLRIGDKISGRWGDKGVVAAIIPDEYMLKDSEGKPFDILINPLTIISRINPSQLHEAFIGKVAKKTNQRFIIEDWSNINFTEYVKDLLNKHGLTDKETVFDPVSGKHIPNIATGYRYFLKLHHMAEYKGKARGLGAYTQEDAPAKGGEESAQRFGVAEVHGILSHGATDVLRDMRLVTGQQNMDFWVQWMSGGNPPVQKVPMVYQKFLAELKAAGLNPVRRGSRIHLFALTNKDINNLVGNRELRNNQTVLWHKEMQPIEGGLFDTTLTGGLSGNLWSYIPLPEPMPNPVMEEPIRKLLGLTREQFLEVLAGKREYKGSTGPYAIKEALASIDVDKELNRALTILKDTPPSRRDDIIKKISYLSGLKKAGIKPDELMWDKLPVIPPIFRPISTLRNRLSLISDANYLYQEVWDAAKVLDQLKGQVSDLSEERLHLYNALLGLVGLGNPLREQNRTRGIKGFLKLITGSQPKYGDFQSKIIGMTSDLVGLSVVVPDPDLTIDEIGIPEPQAWKIFGPMIVRRLIREGLPHHVAVHLLETKDARARKALLEEMDTRPILVTRAPLLHRFGIMAFWPRLVKGHVVRVSPFVVTGFGMDFDGDSVEDCYIIYQIHGNTYYEKISDLINKWLPIPRDINKYPLKEDEVIVINVPLNWNLRIPSLTNDGKVVWGLVKQVSIRKANKIHYNTHTVVGHDILTTCDHNFLWWDENCNWTALPLTDKSVVALPHVKVPHYIPEVLPSWIKNFSSIPFIGLFLGIATVYSQVDVDKQKIIIQVPCRIRCFISDKISNIIEKLNIGKLDIHYTSKRAVYYTIQIDDPAVMAFLQKLSLSSDYFPEELLWFDDKTKTDYILCFCMINRFLISKASSKKPKLAIHINNDKLKIIIIELLKQLEIPYQIKGRYVVLSITKDFVKNIDLEYLCILPEIILNRNNYLTNDQFAEAEGVPCPNQIWNSLLLFIKELQNTELQELVHCGVLYRDFNDQFLPRWFVKELYNTINNKLKVKIPPHLDKWFKFVTNKNIKWDKINYRYKKSRKYLPLTYDFSVIDTENFAIMDGIIVHNTARYHIPVSEEAKDEAIYKMLPSKNLYETRTLKSMMHVPIQEYVTGLYEASTLINKKKQPKRFSNVRELIKALENGVIDIDDPVIIDSIT